MMEKVPAAQNQITEGVIWKQLLLFFFPILFGTFFQQLYNAADAMIVGRFVGKEALSAVGGSSGMITGMIIGFFVGLSSGAAVVISQFYGAGKADQVELAVHTSMMFSVLAGIATTAAGVLLTPWMLHAMRTPDEVMELSVLYLRVYFMGMAANLVYNTGASIMRAAGDSKRPLYILIVSCLINIVLDIVLVVILKLGVFGAALATVLSQLLSAVLVCWYLRKTEDMHRLQWNKVKIHPQMLRSIICLGFPAGLQSVMYGLSNVILQMGINDLGTNSVAAWAAYGKIDSLFWMMVSSFGIAATTFAGQNFGAGQLKRVRQGVRTCLLMTMIASAVIAGLIYQWGIYGYQLFTEDQDVIQIGITMMRYLMPFYLIYAPIEVLSGALRGVGDCWIPMWISLLGVCVIRTVWILFVFPVHPTMYTVMDSYPISWGITLALFVGYYLWFSKLKFQNRRMES